MASSNQSALVGKQLLVDGHVQASLLARAAFYGISGVIYFLVILVFSETVANEDASLGKCISQCLDEAIFWVPGLMLMVPLVVYDLLRLGNQLVGPMFGIRREMRRLIDGESEQPLTFRDGDHWIEMAGLYNQIREEMMLLRDENAQLKYDAIKGTTAEQLFDDDDDDSDTDIALAEADLPLDDLVAADASEELAEAEA